MSKQSIVPEISISNVRATILHGSCRTIHVSWSPSGDATTYQVDRRPLNSSTGITRVPRSLIQNHYDDSVSDTFSYVYSVTVWNARGNPATGTSNVAHANACSKVSSGFLIQSKVNGSFELLFPQGARIDHYRHKRGS